MPASKVFVIAEAGVNHNGSLELAQRLIDTAAEAAADAVKFQSFRADSLVSPTAARAAYQVRNQPGEQSQLEMLRKLELSEAQQDLLRRHADARGIEFMSTPFDLQSLDFLALRLKVKRLKIASGEITNGPLLLRAARAGLPIILSTGMSTLEDIDAALRLLAFGMTADGDPADAPGYRQADTSALEHRVTLLHCTSDYPAAVEDLNLRAMEGLRKRFGLPVGLSDHSLGITAPIAAAALGAAVIEKHFTLDRTLAGPDHRASLEPQELCAMVHAVREVQAALGSGEKRPVAAELETQRIARRSLVAARRIRKGARLVADDLEAKRPGGGVSPMHYWDWIGKVAERDYDKDDPL